MPRLPIARFVGSFCFFAAAGLSALPSLAGAIDRVILAGHRSPAIARAFAVGNVDPAETVNLALVLPLRHEAQLDALLSRLYDPQDSLYGQFLTPSEFAAHFAPSAEDYERVEEYALSQGFTITGTHADRLVLDVSAPAGAAEEAFAVRLNRYESAEGRVFRAPDADPSIPASLSGLVSAVVGLDTAAVRRPHLRALAQPNTIGSGPGGGLSPANIKTAYGLSNVTLNGSGQTLAVFELDGYTASDITSYENYFGLRQVPLNNILVDGASGVPSRGADSGADEVTLDIEMQTALAPGANEILVYEGGNSDQAILDTYDRIASDDLAKSISTCWGDPEDEVTSATLNSENTIFKQMAAQGQSIFAASGDNGAYDDGTTLSVDDPGSQPYVTDVGGTTLTLNGAGGAWRSETTWNGGSPAAGASGGGISSVWPLPSYQDSAISSASLGSTAMRNVPDVALNADPDTGYAVYYDRNWTIFGGTSCAAPLWASFTALVNQQRSANGLSTLGFANPPIYEIGLGEIGHYSSDFHDIGDGRTNLYYPAVPGYDDATGWGSFIGSSLLTDLASGSSAPTVSAPSAPTNLTATPGNAEVALTWTASADTASYSVYRATVSGGPYSDVGTTTNASYTDTGLTNGTTYYYVVTATGAGGTSGYSAQTSATPAAPPSMSPPAAPTNLAATASDGGVTLTWTASVGATSYVILRSSSGGAFAQVGTTIATTYTDTSVTNGTTYTYEVEAVDSSGTSSASNTASATPTTPTVVTSPTSTVTLASGWNLISLPYSDSESLASLFGFSPVTLYVWNPATLAYTQNASALSLGIGYWVYAPQALTIHPSGTTAPAGADYPVSVNAGWNQIGDPFTNSTAVSDAYVVANGQTQPFASAVAAGIVSGTLFSYDTTTGNYDSVTAGSALAPGVGYWFYSYQSATLEIAPQ